MNGHPRGDLVNANAPIGDVYVWDGPRNWTTKMCASCSSYKGVSCDRDDTIAKQVVYEKKRFIVT